MYRTKDGLVFRTKPWKHQLAALRYLVKPENSSAALLLGMGAGKTKIWIDLINNAKFRVTLIVCPLAASRVWTKQFPIHSKNQDICVINLCKLSGEKRVDTVKRHLQSIKSGQQIVFIINYEAIWREPFRSFVKDKMKIDAVICDESHRLKTPSSKVSRFMQTLGRRIPHRYIATGTLLAQSPLDVYGQYRFLDPSVFGTNYNNFSKRYTKIDIQKTMRLGYTVLDKEEPYVNLEDLHNRIMSKAFCVEAELDLPPTRDIIVDFDLDPKTEQLYRQVQKEGAVEFERGTLEVNNALSLVLRLQQLTSGFIRLEDDYGKKHTKIISKVRINILGDLLEELPEDEPVVIFARFSQDIKNIQKLCSEKKRKCSEVSGRIDQFDDWDSGLTSVLIVQIQSGAEGLDFTRARYAVYYSLDHTVWRYLQSRDRLHRPGQKRPVTYYILQAKLPKGLSVDEKILDSLNKKENFIQRVMKDKSV